MTQFYVKVYAAREELEWHILNFSLTLRYDYGNRKGKKNVKRKRGRQDENDRYTWASIWQLNQHMHALRTKYSSFFIFNWCLALSCRLITQLFFFTRMTAQSIFVKPDEAITVFKSFILSFLLRLVKRLCPISTSYEFHKRKTTKH